MARRRNHSIKFNSVVTPYYNFKSWLNPVIYLRQKQNKHKLKLITDATIIVNESVRVF